MLAERKDQFERLKPTDNVGLDVYENAINYIFENPDVKTLQSLAHIVPEKAAF